MSKNYSWRVGQQEDFHKLYALVYLSDNAAMWGVDEIRRRIILPLFLDQLVIFEDDDDVICGFLTIAWMNQASADHQPTIGILPQDWRSGHKMWVVDLFTNDNGGSAMLRTVMRDMDRSQLQEVHYFRAKYKRLREIHR